MCAAMLAVPTATATTEPAVTFSSACRLRTRGCDLVPGVPGLPPVPSRLGGAFRCRQPRHQAVHRRHRWPSHTGASAGQRQRLSAYFDNRGRFQYKVVRQRRAQAQGLASRHLVHGLPLLRLPRAVTVATAPSGVAVTAPRQRQSLGGSWPCRTGLSEHAAAAGATITSRTVTMLEPAVGDSLPRGAVGGFGSLTSTPLAAGVTVYVQDAKSSVFALERTSGRLRWARLYSAPNDGPVPRSWVTASSRRRTRPSSRSTGPTGGGMEPAPGRPGRAVRRYRTCRRSPPRLRQHRGGSRPAAGARSMRSTSARVGCAEVRHDRSAVADRAGRGGGAWSPVSVDAAGRVYAGISNPALGRDEGAPQRRRLSRPRALHQLARRPRRRHGPAPLARPGLPARRPRLRLPRHADPGVPVAVSLCSGQGREVASWRDSDHAPACLVALGGDAPQRRRAASTPADPGVPRSLRRRAHSHGTRSRAALRPRRRAVHDRERSAFGISPRAAAGDGPRRPHGSDAATGRWLWQRALGSAPSACATVSRDVVFVPTFDGRIHALAARTGHELWSDRAPAVSTDACRSRATRFRARRGAAQ